MKKLVSMLLAAAMVMSLCMGAFAITENDYNNGSNEQPLQFTGLGATDTREVKIVLFDSDQAQSSWARGKIILDPSAEEGNYPKLTHAQIAQGYGYYRVRLSGRVLWPAASTIGHISGGVFNLAIKNKQPGGLNPYESQLVLRNKDRLFIGPTTAGSRDDFSIQNGVTNYAGNMTNEEAAGIYKVRFPFAKNTGTVDGGTDVWGNKYWQFAIDLRGLLGKPGDQFEVSLSEFVDDSAIPSFVFSSVSSEGSTLRPSSVTAGTALITIPAEIKYDSNGGAPVEIRSITGAVEGTVDAATPTQQQYNFTRGTDVFIGWSDTKVAEAIETKAELDALSYFVKPGDELVVNSTIFANKEIYAVWAKNTLPTPVDGGGNPIPDDPENPGTQPVPDYKKVPVTFKIVGGKWKDANAASKTFYLMADEESQTAALTNAHISNFVSNTAPHYVNLNNIERELGKDPAKGSWDVRPAATNLSISGATYTFTLGAKDAGYTYINGNTGTPITVDSSDPYADPSKAPVIGTVITGTDADNPSLTSYEVAEINGPDDDNVYTVVAYPEAKDVLFTDAYDNAVDVVKILRFESLSLSHTNEPTNRGYDPGMTSTQVHVTLGGRKLTDRTSVQDVLAKASYARYTPNGFVPLTQNELDSYLTVDVGSNGVVTFTSKKSGAVRITTEDGRELLIVTPGDVNLDGDTNANDWGCIMRQVMEAPSSYDVTDYPDFTVNGTAYDLWMLLADMTSIDVTGSRATLVDSNDWSTLLFLLMEAWK